MANKYWIGDTGYWTDTAHWSLSSGGVSGASVPGSDDDVIIDSNSFTIAGQSIIFPINMDLSFNTLTLPTEVMSAGVVSETPISKTISVLNTLTFPTAVVSTGVDYEYAYRKSVTLSRATGAVDNYQMKVLVGESAGSGTCDVHCNGHCLDFFNDIRFRAADGVTNLDHWNESLSGVTPNRVLTTWVEFDHIGETSTTFYIYYGNSYATTYSSGQNTFIAFDDFEYGADGDTIGGDWTEYYTHVHTSTEQAYTGTRSAKIVGGNASYATAGIPVSATNLISVSLRAYKQNATAWPSLAVFGDGVSRLNVYQTAASQIGFYNGTTWTDVGAASEDAWFNFELNNFDWSEKTYDIYADGLLLRTGATMYAAETLGNQYLVQGDPVAGHDAWFDNFIVRNWRATGPSWGSWGAEESL